MALFKSLLLSFIVAAVSSAAPQPSSHNLPLVIETKTSLKSSYPANIHLYPHSDSSELLPPNTPLKVTYGSCDSSDDNTHERITITKHNPERRAGSHRLIWLIPETTSSGGCISTWDDTSGKLVGRSKPLVIEEDGTKFRKRSKGKFMGKRGGIEMNNKTGIDTNGPWFDGVMLLKSLNLTEVDVEKAKEKRIGIVGGGMAGLMTALLLESKGLKNWHILEASKRIGGRIRTHYFAPPEKYQYQELGPMRFPESIRLSPNLTLPLNDHKLVFSLGDYLNKLNKNDSRYRIDFIPWYQKSPTGNEPVYMGGKRKPDGTVPTRKEIEQNPELAYRVDHGVRITKELDWVLETTNETFFNEEWVRTVAENMFRAHKKFIDEGWNDFSEYGFIRHVLDASLNTTDLAGASPLSFWERIFEGVYFSATHWKTIDKGVQRLANGFQPLINNRISYSRRVDKVFWDSKAEKVTLSWKRNWTEKAFSNDTFDYAVITAPFRVARGWRFSPPLPSLISRAVQTLHYTNACKVALHFKTRFWEHLPRPIYGGCPLTDIPQIETFCYPSYAINSSLPGVLLASYNMHDAADVTTSLSDAEHANYVLNAMAEIHGEKLIREQYTGKFARQCWLLDDYARGSWAEPYAGDHRLYIPEYFKTVNGLVWIGEHTSYTHLWIASALESAVRGSVQLLLELGLVDEAKEVTQEWMGRWIKV